MSIDSSKRIRVVAAVVERQGRYLITQRRSSEILPGLWEFPSGKVERGETDETALKREVRERVGVDVEVSRLRASRTHHYVGYDVDLSLYEASIDPSQELRALRVADFRWVSAPELELYPFPPADQATTDLLLGLRQDQVATDSAVGTSLGTEGNRLPRPTGSRTMPSEAS